MSHLGLTDVATLNILLNTIVIVLKMVFEQDFVILILVCN